MRMAPMMGKGITASTIPIKIRAMRDFVLTVINITHFSWVKANPADSELIELHLIEPDCGSLAAAIDPLMHNPI
jgi:hypothetical protein